MSNSRRKRRTLTTENRPTQADVTGDLQDFLTSHFDVTKNAIELYVNDTFSGSNTTRFENTFGSGVWAWPAVLPALNATTFDIEVSTVYFGILLVPAWTVRQLNPVLMYVTIYPEVGCVKHVSDER